MSIIYYYLGSLVTPVLGQNFGTSLNVRKADGEIITIRRAELEEKDDEPQTFNLSQELLIVPVLPLTTDVVPPLSDSFDDARLELETFVSPNENNLPFTLNVNSFIQEDIFFLSKQMPGLGKATLTKLLNNRPEGGYLDIEHIKHLNHTSFRWEKINVVL